jgi:hypothetical protein
VESIATSTFRDRPILEAVGRFLAFCFRISGVKFTLELRDEGDYFGDIPSPRIRL